MMKHDLNVSPDDCARCQQGCGPNSIDPRACREHFAMAAAERTRPGVKLSHDSAPKKATIDINAIYARRAAQSAPSSARSWAEVVDDLNRGNSGRSAAIDADAIYAKRRADLRASQRNQSPPSSTSSST